MTFQLDKIVPWGRSFSEYIKMFSLNNEELKLNIISCADGPASFNAELTSQGGTIVSVDPIYQFTSSQIKQRIKTIYDEVLQKTHQNKEHYVWENISSIDQLGKIRMAAMEKFLLDFEIGKFQKRYMACELPKLTFNDKEFDIALCSHFLFTYTENLSFDFHLQSIKEMLRVAKEVRIFPLLSMAGDTSEYLQPIINQITDQGYNTIIEKVDYEFQRGGNKMLKIIWKQMGSSLLLTKFQIEKEWL